MKFARTAYALEKQFAAITLAQALLIGGTMFALVSPVALLLANFEMSIY